MYQGVTRYTMDFSIMARDFASLLKENVSLSVVSKFAPKLIYFRVNGSYYTHTQINDPALYDVILPSFSTSTLHDKTICSAMMMSIMQASVLSCFVSLTSARLITFKIIGTSSLRVCWNAESPK